MSAAAERGGRAAVERYDPRCARARDEAATDRSIAESVRRGPGLILWDLVGSCNLRCPSCPVGSMPGTNPRGRIDEGLFDRVLAKLHHDTACRQLHFYNWTEPLLHPRIADFCRRASDLEFHVHLSSNLNRLPDPDALLASGVKSIRISLSGFSQAVYEQGHRGGRIERVRENMRRLADARRRVGARTRIEVYYHRYRHNVDEEPLMAAEAARLGFAFEATWAYYMPLENLLRYAEDGLTAAERRFADESIVPSPGAAIALMQTHRDRPCTLIDQLVLDFQGNAILCCGTYDQGAASLGPYLEIDFAALQSRRYRHDACTRCTHYGLHVLAAYFDAPDLRDAMERLADDAMSAVATSSDVRLPILGDAAPAGIAHHSGALR